MSTLLRYQKNKVLNGAGSGTRTRTDDYHPADFKSAASAIPPSRRNKETFYHIIAELSTQNNCGNLCDPQFSIIAKAFTTPAREQYARQAEH